MFALSPIAASPRLAEALSLKRWRPASETVDRPTAMPDSPWTAPTPALFRHDHADAIFAIAAVDQSLTPVWRFRQGMSRPGTCIARR